MIDKREISPELLARLTVLLFTEVSIKDILHKNIQLMHLSRDDLAKIMMKDIYFNNARSRDNCKAYASSVIKYVTEKTNWKHQQDHSGENYLNVLDLLVLTLQDLLVMNLNRIECRYEDIMSWRWIVRHLGEELPVSARYAMYDHEHLIPDRNRYDDFTWPYVTPQNNKHLNMLVRRGVSDHHCHLWGSTPYFHVSWVNLMNDVTNSDYHQNLNKLKPEKWTEDVIRKRKSSDPDKDIQKHYGTLAQIRSAWIRLYLCELLKGDADARFKREADLQNVEHYNNWPKLLLSRGRLQAELNSYSQVGGNTEDYALTIAGLKKVPYLTDYTILIGERWLYYQIFRDYCKAPEQRALSAKDYDLFLVYFRLRLWARKKMVQTNDYIGFDNFQTIQDRKDYFLGDHNSEKYLTRLAISETLRKKHIQELEVRISPRVDQIARLDNAVSAESRMSSVDRFFSKHASAQHVQSSSGDDIKARYYYVFHFIKQPDPFPEDVSNVPRRNTREVCRHNTFRRKILMQARQIMRFREQKPLLAKRVLGIDAASKEIGCRPEVFGTVYRLLSEHQAYYSGYMYERQPLPALGKTYHVGEDFLDVVDGLRAIDEVIHFLDFDCGDRLGHAIALGVNVDEWYEQKGYEISISIQDYLDNLAWLYHALNHFSISGADSLKVRIVKDFEYWFRIVYRNSITDKNMFHLMKRARTKVYAYTKEDCGRYHEHACHFDIMDYYRSWTLRGDDPACYINGFFEKPIACRASNPEERCKVNTKFPVSFDDRYVPEYSFLTYLYHFDAHVRKEGSREIVVEISQDYINAVKAVQVKMRQRIARRGISIETNPTSNVLIGTFREYEKHPLLNFYNRGLPVTNEEETECAQLQVSINTDDSGVFYTDLETEYALIARATEQIEDHEGVPRFKKCDIYNWLDSIRVMGNEQTFQYPDDVQ